MEYIVGDTPSQVPQLHLSAMAALTGSVQLTQNDTWSQRHHYVLLSELSEGRCPQLGAHSLQGEGVKGTQSDMDQWEKGPSRTALPLSTASFLFPEITPHKQPSGTKPSLSSAFQESPARQYLLLPHMQMRTLRV